MHPVRLVTPCCARSAPAQAADPATEPLCVGTRRHRCGRCGRQWRSEAVANPGDGTVTVYWSMVEVLDAPDLADPNPPGSWDSYVPSPWEGWADTPRGALDQATARATAYGHRRDPSLRTRPPALTREAAATIVADAHTARRNACA